MTHHYVITVTWPLWRLPISLLMIQHPVLALNNYPHHNPETPHDGCETGCYNNHSITRAGIMADREEVEVTTKKLRQWNVLSAQSTANPNSITQHSLCEWDHDIYHWVNIPMEPQSWQHKIIWSTQESQCTKAYRGQELLKPLLETSIMDLGADLLVSHYYSRSLHRQDDSISSSALDHRLSQGLEAWLAFHSLSQGSREMGYTWLIFSHEKHSMLPCHINEASYDSHLFLAPDSWFLLFSLSMFMPRIARCYLYSLVYIETQDSPCTLVLILSILPIELL